MQIPYPLCLDCIYLDLKNKINGKPVCKAFPDGITDDVIKDKSKHNVNKDESCGNGYKFKQK